MNRLPARPVRRPARSTAARAVLLAVTAALAAAVVIAPTASAVAGAEELRELLARYAPAVVPIEAVVRTEMQMGGQGQDEESEVDLLGAVVDPSGLIMVWNSRISSARVSEMMRLMERGGGDFDIDMTPLSFDVRLPGSEDTVQAFLAASDPQLDLAFLQLAEPPGEPLAYFDLGAGVSDGLVGESIYSINRLGPSFAHAPFLGGGRVVGELTKPRKAWIVSGDLQGYGLPVFDEEGRVAGVISTVVSSVQSERAAQQMQGGMAAMMGGGDGKTMGPIGVFVLPAGAVARAVARSKERAAALLEERAAGGGEAADTATEEEAEEAAEEEAPEAEADEVEDAEDAGDGVEEGSADEGPAEEGEGSPEENPAEDGEGA